MSNNPILTIALPTFNRLQSLKKTLQSIMPLKNINEVEILVIDNTSDDGTWEWLCQNKNEFGLCIKRNVTNLGIEGNIIQALLNAQGEYIWLLSDHMKVNANEIITFINHLKGGLEFTFGYARIAEYENVLPETYTPIKLNKIDQYSLGEIIFYVGNISAFIVNRNYILNCARNVFRFSSFTYPQLGVFVDANINDSFIELPPLSNFIADKEQKKRISYDTFRSRFIGFVRSVEEIRRLNQNLRHIDKALKTRKLLGALVSDSILMLSFVTDKAIKPSEFAFCLWHYPGYIRLFLLMCLFLSTLPQELRLRVSRVFFSILTPKQYKKAATDYNYRFVKEIINE